MDDQCYCRSCAKVFLGCNNPIDNVNFSLLQYIIPKKHVMDMIKSSANDKLQKTLCQHFLEDIKGNVTPKEMVHVCDSAGISQKGYMAHYKSLTLGLKAKKVTQSFLPMVYSLQMEKRCVDGDIAIMFNGFKWVDNVMPMPRNKSY